jgi:hypothetical protein
MTTTTSNEATPLLEFLDIIIVLSVAEELRVDDDFIDDDADSLDDALDDFDSKLS